MVDKSRKIMKKCVFLGSVYPPILALTEPSSTHFTEPLSRVRSGLGLDLARNFGAMRQSLAEGKLGWELGKF